MNETESRYLAATIQTSTIALVMAISVVGMFLVITIDPSNPIALWLAGMTLFLDSLLFAMTSDGYNRQFWERVTGGFGPYLDELKDALDRGEAA